MVSTKQYGPTYFSLHNKTVDDCMIAIFFSSGDKPLFF